MPWGFQYDLGRSDTSQSRSVWPYPCLRRLDRGCRSDGWRRIGAGGARAGRRQHGRAAARCALDVGAVRGSPAVQRVAAQTSRTRRFIVCSLLRLPEPLAPRHQADQRRPEDLRQRLPPSTDPQLAETMRSLRPGCCLDRLRAPDQAQAANVPLRGQVGFASSLSAIICAARTGAVHPAGLGSPGGQRTPLTRGRVRTCRGVAR
jgi:hypothetical protein